MIDGKPKFDFTPSVAEAEELGRLTKAYYEAAHALQTGVKAMIQFNDRPTAPTHLRVGINACMADHAGLVRILMEKGVFTQMEYMRAILFSIENEKAAYEQSLSELTGKIITLA